MNTEENVSGTHGDALDVEAARVFDGYLDERESGRAPAPDDLLAAYPHLADRLRACFDVMDLAGDWVSDSLDDGEATTIHETGSRLLETLCTDGEAPPRVMLSEPPGDEPPLTRTPPARASTAGRYLVMGAIAQGGMGTVFRARDAELGRDLALKVLIRRHCANPALVRRFIEEAQIGGQLQHPGIVPIYELGAFTDRRPFLAMKLVRGRTLAALLAERPDPAHELSRFLTVFEQICQAVAYAHARRVIHRDLKPSNVMVGSFGEVQVMDWGLAKVLAEGGLADDAMTPNDVEADVVKTVRSGSEADASHPGTVLGTPAFMPPEQARGAVDRVDERSDVFSLGAILCTILTGKPPYAAGTVGEVRLQALRADLSDALARLDACGAEPDLLELARDCLAPDPASRPRDAGEVAGRVRAHLAGIQERLRTAELGRVEAQARADEERKRRRLAVSLAAAVIGLAVTLGGGGAWWAYESQSRAARVDLTLHGVEVLLDEAERAGDDISRWSAAHAAANHLGPLLDEARGSARTRAASLIEAANRGSAEATADRALLNEIVSITSNNGDGTVEQFDARFAEAFRARRFDPDATSPAIVGRAIAGRPRRVSIAIAYGLDFWGEARRRLKDRIGAERVLAAAREADPDPWRNRLRTAVSLPDVVRRRDALIRLAGEMPEDSPAFSSTLLGMFLFESGDAATAEKVLRSAHDREPGDLWLNIYLAKSLQRLGRSEEAIRYFTAAQTAQPLYVWELGLALQAKGETAGAINVFRGVLRRQPDATPHYIWLAQALQSQGRAQEANDVIDAGIVGCRRWIGREPHSPRAHYNLANILRAKGTVDEAIAEYREAIRLKPDYAKAHDNLSFLLSSIGRLVEAIDEGREAIRLSPEDANFHKNLGIMLAANGMVDEAIVEGREVTRLSPGDAAAHGGLGRYLEAKGDFDAAIAEFREAIRLDPKLTLAQTELAAAERMKRLAGRLNAVIRGEDRPSPADGVDFAQLFYNQGRYAAAARLWADALSADPKLGDDRKAQHRYNAACAAALAGAGKGKDDPPPDESAKAKLRRQARDWLIDELAAWSKFVQAESKARPQVLKTLQHWNLDPDLAGLRDTAELNTLDEAERAECRSLWSEVKALSARAAAR
jgi:serine/threonine-protein kinase